MKVSTFSSSCSTWDGGLLPQPETDEAAIVVFGARTAEDAAASAFADLRERYAGWPLIGCSTSGEIAGSLMYDGTLSGAVLGFEHSSVATAFAEVARLEDSYQAGVALGRELLRPDLRGVFLLSDGLMVNGSELVRGINQALPPDVVVTGGLAGDGDRFERTWVLKDGHPQRGCVSALAFYGDALELGHGSSGGWDAFGPKRLVTKSSANKVYELDNKPALALYKTYLGELADQLPGSALHFPLALWPDPDSDKHLIRTILSVDEGEQSLTFAGDIPLNSRMQLMRGNFDRLIGGAATAGSRAKPRTSGPTLSIAVSCVGRRVVLGERTDEELEAVLDVLPEGSRQVGFYSYGEISPYSSGHCDLHNQTMTLTTIGERR